MNKDLKRLICYFIFVILALGFIGFISSCAHIPNVDPRAFQFEQACVLEKDLASCQLCTELTSALPACWNGLGLAQAEAGDYDSALGFFSLAVQADPNFAQAYNNMAVCQHHLGNDDQAIKLLEKALELDPLYQDAFYNLHKIKGE